jgi:hypothetical protein
MYLKIDSLFDETPYETNVQLRNKSWKPECVGSFNMDWRILVFYPESEARDKIY